MALWLVRAGKYGEHEARFLDDKRIYLTYESLPVDLSAARTYDDIKAILQVHYPGEVPRRLGNWSGQVWAFVLAMKPGDWVVVPRKAKGTIAVGEITGGYRYDAAAKEPYRHSRDVKWLHTDVPRSAFDQDLLYSFGAIMTICEVKRNDAEKRVRAMAQTGWKAVPVTITPGAASGAVDTEAGEEGGVDLEQLARDAIARLIVQKFKGHGMARLVEAVLRAQGFTTHLSPEGPDKGIDILAAGGAFGFDRPRICVQVKSGDAPADRPEFTQLIGAMQSVQADQGLFVAWAGFKPTVLKEVPTHFFKVRLWNDNDLIEQLLANYDKLDEDIRAELPLKRIWTLATPDE
ncbi:restriction endonuclease [Azohydromonas sediminis]|uniref:restriction endonuclease n=1 Tax=Azohydromonas sediminis TaxID=2259674 RepID=UPI000E651AD0|nr:restriction endonuclease [Azohydromonas sediminis]